MPGRISRRAESVVDEAKGTAKEFDAEDLRTVAVWLGGACLAWLLVCLVLFVYFTFDGTMGIAFAPRYGLTRLRVFIRTYVWPYTLLGYQRPVRGMQSEGFRRNCLAPHAPMLYHADHAAARKDPRDFGRQSPWRITLDNKDAWEFVLEPSKHTSRGSDFATGEPISDTRRVPVPSNWQMQGYQPPRYTNFRFPFGTAYPHLKLDNPCGYYRRRFLVPSKWVAENRQIRLCMLGAGPDVEVHLNGESLGYSQDSMTPKEFDLTEAVYKRIKATGSYEMMLCLEVTRFAEGSWLEDQDHWWFSGVHRSVELHGVPRVHVVDYAVMSTFLKPSAAGSSETAQDANLQGQRLGSDVLRTSTTSSRGGEAVGARVPGKGKDLPGEYQEAQALGYGGSWSPLCDQNKRPRRTKAGVDKPAYDDSVLDAERQDVEVSIEMLIAAPGSSSTKTGGLGPEALASVEVRGVVYEGSDVVCQMRGSSDGTRLEAPEAPPGYPGGYLSSSAYSRVSLWGRLSSPRKWSAERPALYTLVLELRGGPEEGAQVYQVEGCRIGFREVSTEGGVVRVNGQPLIVAGANRHEHDPYTGKTVTEDSMRRDLCLLKQHNFNCVRNCHYPNHPRWYELCDEYGIFVVDEANTESHGFVLTSAGSMAMCDPRFKNEVIGRVAAMFERSKNHACVCFLSLGNECGYGPNIKAAREWLRPRTSLPIQYENGLADGDCVMLEGDGRQPLVTDLICPMYDSPAQLAAVAEEETKPPKDNVLERRRGQRPIICCEYGHAMGNSGGNLNVYWDLVWSKDESKGYHRIQGGYIWDWVDQGLTVPKEPLPDGVLNGPDAVAQWRREAAEGEGDMPEYYVEGAWGYGGSFGPDSGTMDRQFCCNGLNFPDRTPHPTMAHLKVLMAPVRFCDLESDQLQHAVQELRFSIENRFSFRSLSHVEFRYCIRVGDQAKPIAEGLARVPLDPEEFPVFPGEKAEIAVAIGNVLQKYDRGVWMELQAVLKETGCGMPAGHVVCERVYELAKVPEATMICDERDGRAAKSVADIHIQYKDSTQEFLASSPGQYRLRFVADGSGSFAVANGEANSPMLTECLKYEFFRAPTDNDQGGAELLFPEVGKTYRFTPQSMRTNFSLNTQWRGLGLHQLKATVKEVEFDDEGTLVVTEEHKNSWGEIIFITRTRVECRREHIVVHARVEPQSRLWVLPTLPRIGMEFTMPRELFAEEASLVYCGGGPTENYADRKTGFTGVFGPLKCDGRDGGKSGGGLTTPYVYPSESGNRSDVRWVAAVDAPHRAGIIVAHSTTDPEPDSVARASGMGQWNAEGMDEAEAKKDPRFAGMRKRRPAGTTPGTCTIGASRYSIDEVYWAKHQCDLPPEEGALAKAARRQYDDINNVPRDCVFRPLRLRVDTAHAGLGGDTSWIPQTHDQFLIHPLADGTREEPNAWEFSLCIKPVPEAVLDDASDAGRIRERVYAAAVNDRGRK